MSSVIVFGTWCHSLGCCICFLWQGSSHDHLVFSVCLAHTLPGCFFFSCFEQFDSDVCFSLVYAAWGSAVILVFLKWPILHLWNISSCCFSIVFFPLFFSHLLTRYQMQRCWASWFLLVSKVLDPHRSWRILHIFPSVLLSFFRHNHFSSSPSSLLFFVHMVSIYHKFHLINLMYLIWWASCWSCLLALFVDFSVDPPLFLFNDSSPVYLNTEMAVALELLFADDSGDIVRVSSPSSFDCCGVGIVGVML